MNVKKLILNTLTGRLADKAMAAYGCENLHNPPRGHGHCSGCTRICSTQLHCIPV